MTILRRSLFVALVGVALVMPSVTITNRVAQAGTTIAAARTGNWSDPTTWSIGRIPGAGDLVVIPAGLTVTYDRFSEVEIAKLTIRGRLRFSRTAGTRLDTGNVIVENGGHLDMGTPADPIPANIEVELRLVTSPGAACGGGPMFNEQDVGVWVFPGGRWDIYGWPLRHTWVKLIADAPAGATVLRVGEDVSDWDAGSTVIITPTSRGLAVDEFEERQIVRVAYTGSHSEILLSRALNRGHSGAERTAAEVALLSRNVVVTSKYPTFPMKAHTMYMANSTGSMGYAEFRDLGMFGCLGRYPVHFHMMQDSSRGMAVRGVSIWRSDNHFLNVHASNGVTIEDAVGYDTTGVGYFIGEPADGMLSVDNTFIHNLAAKVVWRPGALDGQQRAAGFWINSRNSTLIDNVASGSSGTSKVDSGFHIAEHGEFTSTFHPLVMVRNESHSNKSNGLFSWTNAHESSVILDLRAWRNGSAGIRWGAYGTRFQVHRARLFENGEYNLFSTVIRMHLQDSVLYGSTSFPTPTGLFISGYFLSNDPATPSKLLRNEFSGHSVDLAQDHSPCTSGAEELDPYSRVCSAAYVVAVANRFQSPQAINFGWQRNANSWLYVRGWNGFASPAITASNFRLIRKDRPRPDVDAYYYAPFDAWLDPTASAPPAAGTATVQAAGTKRNVKPTPAPTPSASPGLYLLPTISFVSPNEGATLGGSVTLEVSIAGSNSVTNVRFFADEQLLATVTSAPYRYTWSTGNWTRRRAYVYACVTDAAGNYACTPVVRLSRTGS